MIGSISAGLTTIAAVLLASPAAASTLFVYEVDTRTGQMLAGSAFADQDISRMENQGLIRPVAIALDDSGDTVEQVVDVVRAQPVAPLGGTRILNGRATWRMSTTLQGGRATFVNRIMSEQGFDNGQGPWTDYRRSEVEVSVDFEVPPPRGRVSFARTYTTNRGTFTMIGLVRP